MNKIKKYWYKYTNKSRYIELKEIEYIKTENKTSLKKYEDTFKNIIQNNLNNIKNKTVLNFKHSGHSGDIVYALPIIKELSKTHICNLYLNINLDIGHRQYLHISKNFFLTKSIANKLIELFKLQEYINEVKILENEIIDIDLDNFRKLPMTNLFLSNRWYFHLTGIQTDLSKKYLDVKINNKYKNTIAISRSLRYRNPFVSYSFLNKYSDNLLFIGLKDEYDNIKNEIPNLKYEEINDFVLLAEIINSCKFYIGNQSFIYSLAEALKTPRLLEACSYFPVVHPIGKYSKDFYFQEHFEIYVTEFYEKLFS